MAKSKQHQHGDWSYTNHRTLAGAMRQAREQSPDARVFVNAKFRYDDQRYGKGQFEWRTIHSLSRPEIYNDYFGDDGQFDGYDGDISDVYGGQSATGYQVWVG